MPTEPPPDQVYRQLRKAIVDGVFAPGESLTQVEIANRLGLAGGRVREALPRLEAEGFVVLHPPRGCAVATLESDDIREAFDLRGLLEMELARRAIGRRTMADVSHVLGILAEMTDLACQPSPVNTAQWLALDDDFHNTLLAPARCPHHMRALEDSRGLLETYIRNQIHLRDAPRESLDDHAHLARAFVSGRTEMFVQLTWTHLQHMQTWLLADLERAPRVGAASAASDDPARMLLTRQA